MNIIEFGPTDNKLVITESGELLYRGHAVGLADAMGYYFVHKSHVTRGMQGVITSLRISERLMYVGECSGLPDQIIRHVQPPLGDPYWDCPNEPPKERGHDPVL